MNNEEYWAQRAEERELAWHKKSQETIEMELSKVYRDALGKIQTEIAALYGRYAKDNQLTMADAKKLLQGSEYRTWRMSLEQYIIRIDCITRNKYKYLFS